MGGRSRAMAGPFKSVHSGDFVHAVTGTGRRRGRRVPEKLIRQWKLVSLLQEKRRGATVSQLMADLGGSRATIFRDLDTLTAAGLPLAKDIVNSETRYRLLDEMRFATPSREQTGVGKK